MFRDVEGFQEFVVPGHGRQVEEQRAARVGHVRHMGLKWSSKRKRDKFILLRRAKGEGKVWAHVYAHVHNVI